MSSKTLRALGVAVVSIVLVAAGWFAAGLFVSPEQRAASAHPPEPSVVTATVEYGALSRVVASRAMVEYQHTYLIDGFGTDGPGVVTGNPVAPGDDVDVCMPVVEVNGRPVLAVPGEFPFYRAMVDGDTGVDVLQLREALNDCGHPVPTQGPFNAEVLSALGDLYQSVGYELSPGNFNAPVELVVVNSLRVAVTDVASTGTIAGDQPAATVAGGSLVLRSSVPHEVALGLPDIDARATLGDQDVPLSQARLLQAESEEGLSLIEMELPADSAEAFPVGSEVVVRFTLEELVGEALIVPSSAVVSEGADRSVVYVESPEGRFTAVVVTELATLDGRTAVDAEGEITQGDVVLVGRQ